MSAMRQPPATRRFARELALRVLYQSDVLGETVAQSLDDVLSEPTPLDPDEIDAVIEELPVGATFPRVELDPGVIAFIRRLVRGVDEHRAEIDAVLDDAALNWTVKRMSAVDRNVLRLGAAEILYSPDVPLAVALSEAISLAKRYGGRESGAFVNGVLDRVARRVREAELPVAGLDALLDDADEADAAPADAAAPDPGTPDSHTPDTP